MNLIKILQQKEYPFSSLSKVQSESLIEISALLEGRENLFNLKKISDGLIQFQYMNESEINSFKSEIKKILFESASSGVQVIQVENYVDFPEMFSFGERRGKIPFPGKGGGFTKSSWFNHIREGGRVQLGRSFLGPKNVSLFDKSLLKNNASLVASQIGNPRSSGSTECEKVYSYVTSTNRKEFSPSGEAFWSNIRIIRYKFLEETYREEIRFLLNEKNARSAPHFWLSLLIELGVQTGSLSQEIRRISSTGTSSADRNDIFGSVGNIDPLGNEDSKIVCFSPLFEWENRLVGNKEQQEFLAKIASSGRI
jgi:hypothetical protein